MERHALMDLLADIRLSNLKENWPLLFSGLSFSVLLFQLPRLWQLLSAVLVLVLLFVSLYFRNIFTVYAKSNTALKVISILSAVLCEILCFVFCSTYEANKLPVFVIVILLIISSLFLTILINAAFLEIIWLAKKTIRVRDLTAAVRNIESNFILVISAFIYIRMNVPPYWVNFISLFLSFIVILVLFSQCPNVLARIKKISVFVKIYAAVSALGICYYSALTYRDYASEFPLTGLLIEAAGNKSLMIFILSYVSALVAFLAVFVYSALLLDFVVQKLKPLFFSISKIEILVYSILFLILMTLSCYAFIQSRLFWGSGIDCDFIYVFDTSDLVDPNAYFCLCHHQNDLKQPLFAAFAGPIVGFGYFLSIPFRSISEVLQPIFIEFVQIILLILTEVMIAKMLKTDTMGRICYVIVSSATYTTLLSSVVMEQYIIAVFWLIFAVFDLVENEKMSGISFTAAAGTLLTGFVLLFPSCEKDSDCKMTLKSITDHFAEKTACFLTVLLLFARTDVLLSFASNVTGLSAFAKGYGLFGRLNQYLSFISSLFIAPDAGPSKIYEHISWQLDKSIINTTSILGVVIFLICILSFIINEKNKLNLISGMWAAFSFVLLFIVGWGSGENAMIIYSLCFGWSYYVLLFEFIAWIAGKIKFKALIPVFCLAAAILLVVFNQKGIRELLNYAHSVLPLR